MNRTAMAVVLGAFVAASPVRADEVEQALEAALEAYRAGNVALAQEEVDFAAGLLQQRQATSLESFLPDPLPGWTVGEGGGALGGIVAPFGGGLAAQRRFRRDDQDVEISMMADNPMVASMAALMSNPAALGQGGTLKRIAGQRVMISADGELTAMVAQRFLVQVSGSAPVEAKEAYFAAIDFDGLKAF